MKMIVMKIWEITCSPYRKWNSDVKFGTQFLFIDTSITIHSAIYLLRLVQTTRRIALLQSEKMLEVHSRYERLIDRRISRDYSLNFFIGMYTSLKFLKTFLEISGHQTIRLGRLYEILIFITYQLND